MEQGALFISCRVRENTCAGCMLKALKSYWILRKRVYTYLWVSWQWHSPPSRGQEPQLHPRFFPVACRYAWRAMMPTTHIKMKNTAMDWMSINYQELYITKTGCLFDKPASSKSMPSMWCRGRWIQPISIVPIHSWCRCRWGCTGSRATQKP